MEHRRNAPSRVGGTALTLSIAEADLGAAAVVAPDQVVGIAMNVVGSAGTVSARAPALYPRPTGLRLVG